MIWLLLIVWMLAAIIWIMVVNALLENGRMLRELRHDIEEARQSMDAAFDKIQRDRDAT